MQLLPTTENTSIGSEGTITYSTTHYIIIIIIILCYKCEMTVRKLHHL